MGDDRAEASAPTGGTLPTQREVGTPTRGEQRVLAATTFGLFPLVTLVSWFDTPGVGFWFALAGTLGAWLAWWFAVRAWRRRGGRLDGPVRVVPAGSLRGQEWLFGATALGWAAFAAIALAVRLSGKGAELTWPYVVFGGWWLMLWLIVHGYRRRYESLVRAGSGDGADDDGGHDG